MGKSVAGSGDRVLDAPRTRTMALIEPLLGHLEVALWLSMGRAVGCFLRPNLPKICSMHDSR